MRRSGADKESASLATAGSVPDLRERERKSQAITKIARNQLLTKYQPDLLTKTVTAVPEVSQSLDMASLAADSRAHRTTPARRRRARRAAWQRSRSASAAPTARC